MGLFDGLRKNILNWLMPEEYAWYSSEKERLDKYEELWDYARGAHKKQLKVKPRQADDNIALNFVSLIIERSISLLFGEGVEFDLPGEDETPQDEYLAETWKANHKPILLHKAAQLATTFGTGYLKILPNSFESQIVSAAGCPRFIPINPVWASIETEPEDMDRVMKYVLRFNAVDGNGDEVARKEEIERVMGVMEGGVGPQETDEVVGWTVRNYLNEKGRWELTSEEPWDWSFPPMLHWQNLPNAVDVYGLSDIEDAIDMQDRINFVASNISKIIRYHAHPRTWGRGMNLTEKASWGADEVIMINSPEGMLSNLEMASELGSSSQFLNTLRQALMDISRTVDISSMADKLGALTNFGLRVLYQDAIAKLATKRQLYGAALTELNRRTLLLAGWKGEEADPGVVVWPETLPTNELEDSKAVQLDLEMGLVSKQTAAGLREYDWDQEVERMEAEAASADNIGAALLRAFEVGR